MVPDLVQYDRWTQKSRLTYQVATTPSKMFDFAFRAECSTAANHYSREDINLTVLDLILKGPIALEVPVNVVLYG